MCLYVDTMYVLREFWYFLPTIEKISCMFILILFFFTGSLRDLTGKFDASYHFLGSGLLLSFILLFVETIQHHRKSKLPQQDAIENEHNEIELDIVSVHSIDSSIGTPEEHGHLTQDSIKNH